MPKIQRSALPPDLLLHLLRRVKERKVTMEALQQVLRWVETNPTVPSGDWYKRFPEVTVCGRDSLVRTFLTPTQVAIGREIE